MKQRCLMIGAGGMARVWNKEFWPPYFDRAEIVALVDINPQVLNEIGDFLVLPDAARFTDVKTAFEQSEADFVCIVSPPMFHQQAVELACARGMDILSEKPIADSWEACKTIYRMVKNAGVKMLVVQNYRYDATILTLKKAIADLGEINFIAARFAEDYRRRGCLTAFRHEMPHPIMVEMAIHHLDQIRNLSGADCQFVTGFLWNPNQTHQGGYHGGDSFDSTTSALFSLQMTNGSFAQYEGHTLQSGETHGWHREYYRAECENGVATLSNDGIVRVTTRENSKASTREITIEKPERAGHLMLPQQFLDWREGGPTPPTNLDDNMQSAALMFGAIQAAQTRCVVDVQAFLREAMA